MKDIINISKRLIQVSDLIIKEIDILANLSYMYKEDTNEFKEHVNIIKEYLNKERIILNNIDIDILKKVHEYLSKNDDLSDGYARTYIEVTNKLNELMDDDSYNEEESNEEDNINIEDNNLEDISTEYDLLTNYMEDTSDISQYEDSIVDYISTLAIKKMLSRINNTYTDNKNDLKYKKRLSRYFNHFKYYYFTLDNRLERLGATYSFNIERMPIIPIKNIDSTNVYNNECVSIINNLYLLNNTEYDLEKISIALFESLCLEEYINNLDIDKLNKLLDLCNNLDNLYKDSFYGNIAKNKILEKKKN